jgi:hypothetical protein
MEGTDVITFCPVSRMQATITLIQTNEKGLLISGTPVECAFAACHSRADPRCILKALRITTRRK